MPDPNFLVIGAQKAGTTWLAEMLKQHPDILTARRKEVFFFANDENYQKGVEWYRKQFPGYKGEKAIGEFTPHYLWPNIGPHEFEGELKSPEAHIVVHEHYPGMKLIVSLRATQSDGRFRPSTITFGPVASHQGAAFLRWGISMESSAWGTTIGILRSGRLFPRDQFLILIFEEQIAKTRSRP